MWLAPPDAAERRALVARLAFARRRASSSPADRPPAPTRPTSAPARPPPSRLSRAARHRPRVAGAARSSLASTGALPGAAATLGDVLVDAGILIRPGGGGYELAPDALDPSHLAAHVFALLARLAEALTGAARARRAAGRDPADPRGRPVRGRTRYGARLSLPEPSSSSPPAACGSSWRPAWSASPRASPGVELLVASLPTGGADPLQARVDPAIRIRGLGLRALGEEGGHLVDLVASIDALAIHGVYERDAAGVSRAGGRILLVNLGVPLGRAAGGGNPVAAKVLSGGAEERPAGDQAGAAAGVLAAARDPPRRPAAGAGVVLGRRGRRARGGCRSRSASGRSTSSRWGLAREPVRPRALPDRRRRLAGRADRRRRRPLAVRSLAATAASSRTGASTSPASRSATQGGAIAIAGGLRKRPGTPPAPPDYVGMLQVKAGQFQLAAVRRLRRAAGVARRRVAPTPRSSSSPRCRSRSAARPPSSSPGSAAASGSTAAWSCPPT